MKPRIIIASLLLTVFLAECAEKKTNETKTGRSTITYKQIFPVLRFCNYKKICDSLFVIKKDSSYFQFQNNFYSLFIGNLFLKEKKHAVLRYKITDTSANVIVLKKSGEKWDTILHVKDVGAETSFFDDLVTISDFNGDGISDLKVIKEAWDIHPGERAYLWLFVKGNFRKVQGFEKIRSSQFDNKTKLIYSYQSAGCADMAMEFGVYKIEGQKVKTIQEMYCGCCESSGDSCIIEIKGQKPFKVSSKNVHNYVPAYFAEGVKNKIILNNQLEVQRTHSAKTP